MFAWRIKYPGVFEAPPNSLAKPGDVKAVAGGPVTFSERRSRWYVTSPNNDLLIGIRFTLIYLQAYRFKAKHLAEGT